MGMIYELKKRAKELSQKRDVDSVNPSEVGNLIDDTLELIDEYDKNVVGLGIRKTYVTVAAMEADKIAPVGSNGKLLKFGQLVNVYDHAHKEAPDNGNLYAFQNPEWELVSKLDAGYATQDEISQILAKLNSGFLYGGIAYPDINPGIPISKSCYIAVTNGVYTHFGNMTISRPSIISYNGNKWGIESLDLVSRNELTTQSEENIVCAKYDNQGREINSVYAEKQELSDYNVSAKHPEDGIDGTNIYTFEKAIIKIPTSMRNGGVKCVFLAYDLANSGKNHAETWIFNGGIYVDKNNWSKLSTKMEQDDIDVKFQESLDSMSQEINTELALAINQINVKVDEAVKDKTSKPLIISQSENKAGTYSLGGETLDIWERSVQLLSLPKKAGEIKEYVVADEPLGFGLYLNVESLIASTGKGMNKEFFTFNYEITRFYINSQLQSCVVVKCKNAVADVVNGVLHIQYCKFWGDVVEFDITLPSSVEKEAVALEIPALKYNKKMIFSYITDDSYSIYQYIFSLINKRLVAKKFGTEAGSIYVWHLGMQGKTQFDQFLSEEYYPENFAQCSDGAGIKHRYATTVSAWPDKLKDKTIGQDVGMQWPWMSEKEFKLYFDFGYMCAYHDLIGYEKDKIVTQEQFDKCVNDTVSLFKEYVGIIPKLMVEPNGDHKYIDFSQNNPIIQLITAQTGDSRIQSVYPFRNDFTLSKSDVSVKRIFAYGTNDGYKQDLLDILSTFNSTLDESTIYWLIGSAHRSDYWESELITRIHELYGDIGNDSLWFPTLDEFFEYWYMRENTLSVKTITDTGVHCKMYIPKGANFFFRDLSVLVSGVSSLEGVNVTSGDNVFGTSFAINDGKLLVNLDFNQLLMDRVNKYVEMFEKDYNAEYAYDDAYYFVQKLKTGLREPYLARINKWVSPPVLESFNINNGQDFTQDHSATLNIVYSGQIPSHYMASEKSDFAGASWIEYTKNPSFRLSDAFDTKTIYVKLKNVYGETTTLSDSITLLEPTLNLTSVAINGGAASTTTRNVTMSFNYVGYPTHYMVSESSSFTGAVWVTFNPNPNVKLSEAYGNKTLYVKMKNATTETVYKFATIELVDTVTARLNSIVINNGTAFTDSGNVSIAFDTLNTITKYKVGKLADLSDCPEWIAWSGSPIQFNSAMAEGSLTVYAQVGNVSTESGIKSDSIQVVQPVAVTGMVLASDQESFAGYTIPVSFSINQGIPTHYRLSETVVELNSATWLAWNDNITYKFGSIGNKTLYGQVKNTVSESSVVNDAVILTEPPVKIIIGFNASANNAIEYPLVNGETINQVKPASYSGYEAKQLKDTQGELLPWYYNLHSGKYSSNSIFSTDGMNNFISDSTANNDGVYPVSTFLICHCCAVSVVDGSKKMRLSFTLPMGHYKARILYSPADNFLLTEQYRTNSYYGVFEGTDQRVKVNVGITGFTGKGNKQYNNEFEFDVTVSNGSDIDFAAWQEGSPIQNYRPGINLLELTKLS